MAYSQISDVRSQMGDTDATAYAFADAEVTTAIEEADALIDLEAPEASSAVLRRRVSKLMAAHNLVAGRATGNVKQPHVRALSEADARLDLEDLTAKAQEWRAEALGLLAKLQAPLGVSTWGDYAAGE